MSIHYEICVHDARAHLFAVRLTIASALPEQQVSMPVWIPGSYMVREFARHVQGLERYQKINKNTWQLDCLPCERVEIAYYVYAFDTSVRAAYLDDERGFFNGTSVFLRVNGQENRTHTLTVLPYADWSIAHSLNANSAQSYDELVDHPVAMGKFWSASFAVRNVPHRLVLSHAPGNFDRQRLVQDARRIAQACMDFWHSDPNQAPPHTHYTFFLHASQAGFGGLEHKNSSVLEYARSALPQTGSALDPVLANKRQHDYVGLLGLISHEYFHAWNVKTLRPPEFSCYHYDRENYSTMLWFYEGFTSYYDDLMLYRAGLIDAAQYCALLEKNINQVLHTPGRHKQSLAQASFDAWIKYYRPDANSPNSSISYYQKGALVALCFDLSLRRQGQSLDMAMRHCLERHQRVPLSEHDFSRILTELTGLDWSQQLREWVHETCDLPLHELLSAHGLRMGHSTATLAQRLGLGVRKTPSGMSVHNVLNHSAAEQASLAPGDDIVAVVTPDGGWRLQDLEDLSLYIDPDQPFTLLTSRDGRLRQVQVLVAPDYGSGRQQRISLSIENLALAQLWLKG